MTLPPAVFSVLDQEKLFHLQTVIAAGDACGAEIVERWGRGRRFLNAYGPTETTVCASVGECDPDSKRRPTIGRPIANTRLYILDRGIEPMPAGGQGELYVSGVGVARGYWERPELTAERFIPDAFSSEGGERLYRTGDVCRYLFNGEIEFIGRVDDQVKVRGHRIEPGEIEQVLSEQKGVRQAAVVVREDNPGQKRLVAYVVPDSTAGEKNGAQPSSGNESDTSRFAAEYFVDNDAFYDGLTGELRRAIEQRLPSYMAPAAIVLLKRLPVTPNGKIDRKRLSFMEYIGRKAESEYVGPLTPTEKILSGIFETVLNRDRVGVHDNFFELGGDSILSIQIISRANEAGLRLTPKQLFQHQSIAELAAVAGKNGAIQIEQGDVVGEAPLTPVQEWFFEDHTQEPEYYNQAVMLEVEETLDIEIFREVIKKLVKQHDVLRHKFHRAESWWMQTCEPDGSAPLEEVDISGVDEHQESRRIEAAAIEYQRKLNLSNGPLMRVVVFKGKGRRQRVLVIAHHLVIDGVSWRILLGDIERGYEQARRGEEITLGAKTTSYKRWAERLKAEAQSESSREKAGYWLALEGKRLRGVPIDKVNAGANSVEGSKSVTTSLSEEETATLLQEVARTYKTQINEVLLVAVARSISEWSGEETVLIDVEGHGREEIIEDVDLTRTVGWFTSFYPIKIEVKEADCVEILRNAKEQIREANRRGIYYGMLKYLSDEPELRERLRALPQAEISFNYLGQLDLVLRKESLFRAAEESPGETQSGKEMRSHLIGINGSVTGGRLHLAWDYSEDVHERETIERVAERTIENLREVVAGSRSTNKKPYTPSDFPLATLDQQRLDRLMRTGQDLEDIYILSPLQKAMLFHTLSGVNPQALFIQLTCRLRGKVDVGAFKKAWQTLVDRHPVLRTAFEWEDLEHPVQVVRRRVELPIDYMDWGSIRREEQEHRFEVLAQADRWRGFDISSPPLMRLSLIRLADNLHRLIWSHHHILLDGWCSPLILGEVLASYEAYLEGKEPVIEERAPYREYIGWLNRQDLEKAAEYWREKLKGFNRPTTLSIDRRPGGMTGQEEAYEDQQVRISEEVTARLQTFARLHRLTMNTILQGAWGLALGKYSGEEDVLFGATVSGRPVDLPGSGSMIGPFINTLPIRIHIPYRSSLRAWLSDIQNEQVEYGQYAYSSMVEQYSEVPLGMPLFESILIFENYPVEQRSENREQGLEVSDAIVPVRTKYPLTVVSGPGSELLVSIAYDLRRFENSDISRLLAHLQNIIGGIANNPEQPIWSLSPLLPAERDQMLKGWEGTKRIDPNQSYVHHLYEAQVEKSPDAIAVIFGHDQIGYGELNRRANQLAARLQTIGVGPEFRVGLYLEPSPELLIGLLGVLKAGGTCVILEPAVHRAPLISMALRDVGAQLLLTQRSLVESDLGMETEIIRLDSDWEVIGKSSGTNPQSRVMDENLAFIIYTSGATEAPKQVMITHRGLRNHLLGTQVSLSLTEENKLLQKGCSCFVVSILDALWPLLTGARLVIAESEVCRNRAALLDLIGKRQVTIAAVTPSMYMLLLREEGVNGGGPLSRIILTGETLFHHLAARSFARMSADLYNTYSVSEASGVVMGQICSPQLDREIVPIGQPVANTQIYVLDSQLQPVPAKVNGEVWISGQGLARGYAEQPELTAERFIPNPFSADPGERMLETGDIARCLPDGQIEILSRSENQIKIKFGQVEPTAIEGALMAYPGIDQAVVLLARDVLGEARLTAYLTWNADTAPSTEELRRFLRERFPAPMVPSAFLIRETLPLTINGRIDRKALVELRASAGDAEIGLAGKGSPYEEILRTIWIELFGVEEVSRKDNFFEMGGHSLLATQVMSRIRDVFKVEIPLRSLFEEPTIEGLARRIEEAIEIGEKVDAPPFVRVSREVRLPLSFAQQRLWFMDQLAPGNPVYNCPGAVRLEGRLDLAVLERSVNEIIKRHEALRTRIELDVEEGTPFQAIDEWRPLRLDAEDLTGLPREERENEVRRIAENDARTGFDLRQGPLMRSKVLKLDREHHVLLFNMHHIVSDAWSMGVIVREVCALYEAMSEGQGSPLPELEIQYADYAKWQREYLAGETLEREVSYWKERLKDSEMIDLPTDYARPSAPSYRGAVEKIQIGKKLSEGLTRLSQREGVTLFMTLMAAFKALLMRYSGQEDLSVGTSIANRTRRELEGLIGFFVNMLVMRTNLGGDPSFRQLIKREREVALGAYAHQEIPFEKLVEEINPDRDLSRSPLFQVMLVLQNTGQDELEISGLKVSGIEEQTGTAKFDLLLLLKEGEEGIAGIMEYSQDLYEAETIRTMLRHYEMLLEEVVRDAEQRVREIELMNEEEKKQILEEWNWTESLYPKDRCIHELFAEQALQRPEQIALISERRWLSYGELNRRSNQLAHYLQRLGMGPEMRVGLCLERSIETIVAVLGVLKAGGVYLPLDPDYPLERLAFMLEDAGVAFVLTQQGFENRLPANWGQTVLMDLEWEKISHESESEPESRAVGENLAYIIYTSGSSGKPKGVAVPHRAVLRLLLNTNYVQLDQTSCLLQLAPQTFDAATFEMWGALLHGGRLAIASMRVPSEAELGQMISQYGVETMWLTASLYNAVVDGDVKQLRALKQLLIGGEALSVRHVRAGMETLEQTRLINGYGPTEGTTFTCSHEIKAEDVAEWKRSVPIGRPISNTKVYVLDKWMGVAPVGVVGELHIGEEGLARCYFDRPEMTAEKFIPHPYSKTGGERLYRTGDAVRYLSDGTIEFSGRVDEQVKVRGHRIEPGEIEVVLNEHQSVKQSVVVVSEDESGGKRLVAYVVGEDAPAGELKLFLRERLPDYMVPEVILTLEEMPVTANGKIDRKRLPSLKDARGQVKQDYVGARTPIEEILLGIFEEVLKPEQAGIRDDFFDLGGHSLLATQVVSRIRAVFGLEIGIAAIFEAPTVEGLALRIEDAIRAEEKAETPPLVRVSREGRLPLSFAQQRLWFLDQLVPNNPFYNCPCAVKLEGSLASTALEYVINEIIRRHEVLRTRIEVEENEPVQVIDEWEPRKLEIRDLTGLTSEERQKEVRRIMSEELETGFDLRRGQLLRVKLLKLEDKQHVLIFTMHHIVSDAWSLGVLVREVCALYKAHIEGNDSPLEELPIQYADFAVWQRAWLNGKVLEEEFEYWRKQLAGVESLELPTDHPRPAKPSYRGASQLFLVEAGIVSALRELSKQEGATLFMTLLAAFQTLLYRYTGQEDIVVGTPVANRNRLELEGLIGFFVNTLAMRIKLSPEDSFRDLLHQVRKTALAAYSHDQVPFERLVMEVSPKRTVGLNPIFQAWFYLEDEFTNKDSVLPDLLVSPIQSESVSAKLDLALTMIAGSDGISGDFTYATDLFEPETIITLIDRFQFLLQAIAANPDCKLLDIPLESLSSMKTLASGAIDEMQATFSF